MFYLRITLIIIIILIAIIAAAILISANSRKKQFKFLLDSFGKIKDNNFTYEEYESISHYFKNTVKPDELCIDDITWHDLDMDKIFLMLNNTNSAVGRDFLYKILRVPATNAKELCERERLIRYFDENDTTRTTIMQSFCDIGFTRKHSVSDHVDLLLNLKPDSNIGHYLCIISIIGAALFTAFIDAVIGIFFIIVTIAYSILSYYKIKGRIDSFFVCIRQIVAMINCARTITRLNIKELDEYNKRLAKLISAFTKITNNSWLLVSSKNISGNLSDILMEYLRMLTHIDLIKFNNMLKNLDNNKEEIYSLMETLGLLEAMISIANFRRVIPYYSLPEFANDTSLEIKDVYHLLIDEPVANSINTSKPVLLTGSNASGKSTFLKSVAINTILAQSINTCLCSYYRAPFYNVMSSMALSDNLDNGESYYIVEIKSLKRIVDASNNSRLPVLCFIDEVLRGTNTVERISASTEILKTLSENGVMCFAATHDIELTDLLTDYYVNYHFTEEIKDGNIYFSYILHDGKATSRNAIRLLEIIGYDKDIIYRAQSRAEHFVTTGKWRF